MGSTMTLSSADGHSFSAYRADPPGRHARAGVVVVQEIFGVNAHIREVCDWYADHGYWAIAPALFDRVDRGFERGYTPDTIAEGVGVVGKLNPANTLADIAAAATAVRPAGKVGVVGYCFGGTMAAAASINLAGTVDAAVSYYGGGTVGMTDQQPKTPLMCHYGDLDAYIPGDQVATIRQKWPMAIVHQYDADHGFNCDHRESYNAGAAKLAQARTLSFFSITLA